MEYKEYKEIIISTGEAIRMGMQHSLDGFEFKKSLNIELTKDDTLTSDDVLAVMHTFNSYYELDIIHMLKHKNTTSEIVEYLVNSSNGLNSGDLKKYFLASIMKYDHLLTKNLVDITFNYGARNTDIAVLESAKAIELLDDNTLNLLMYTLKDLVDDPETVKRIKLCKHLEDYFLMLFNTDGVTAYLPEAAVDVFLF